MWPHIAECRRCCCCRLRHCRHNGLIRPIDIILRIFTIIRLKTTTKTTATTMHEWLKYHCGDIRLPFFLLNQWICKLYIFITRACMCACELSHEWTKDLSSSFFFNQQIHFMGKETCTTIYMQQNLYWQKEEEKKYMFNVYFSSCTLTLYLNVQHLLCYCCCFVFCLVAVFFFFFSCCAYWMRRWKLQMTMS